MPTGTSVSNISWGSSLADKAEQTVKQLCGQVVIFTASQDCFALTSSLHHVGDGSSCWGRGLRAEGIRRIIRKRYDKSKQWIEITTKEFGNDPHEFVKRVEHNGGTILRHDGKPYISTDTLLSNTYEGIDTVQITLNREGQVTRHSNIQRTDESRMTRTLLNVEDGYGHIVVMMGSATELVRRCSEHCEPIEVTQDRRNMLDDIDDHIDSEEYYNTMKINFQSIYYGMADAEDAIGNKVPQCEPEQYLRMINLGALEQAGRPRLTEDTVSIHTELERHITGNMDINESAMLTLVNTQETGCTTHLADN